MVRGAKPEDQRGTEDMDLRHLSEGIPNVHLGVEEEDVVLRGAEGAGGSSIRPRKAWGTDRRSGAVLT